MKGTIEVGDRINDTYLKTIVTTKLRPAAEQILQTGAAPFVPKPASTKAGKPSEEPSDKKKARIATAIETYNSKTDGFIRFPYPEGYASLAYGKDEDYRFGDVFTDAAASFETQEAVFAVLAARQALAGSRFRYPMTYFVGPTGNLPEGDRLERFSRVVFGNLGSTGRYMAMVTFTHSYPRRAYAVAWIPESENEGAAANPGTIGETVATWWTKQGREKLVNDAILRGGLTNEFIRSTGSTDIHSVLWPIIKLSMTTDESKLYAPLGTNYALGGWISKTDGTEFGETSSPWHRWTMGLLAYGSIPYKKHSDTDPEPWYGQHMTRDTLDTLAKAVQIKEA